jgi:hypothetical protein
MQGTKGCQAPRRETFVVSWIYLTYYLLRPWRDSDGEKDCSDSISFPVYIAYNYKLRLRAPFEKIHLDPSPVQDEMDDKKDDEQYAVRIVDLIEKDVQIYVCVSLAETANCLYKHEEEENRIYDLEEFLFHDSKLYEHVTDCQAQSTTVGTRNEEL